MLIRDAVESDVPQLTEINRWAIQNTLASFARDADDEDQRRAWMLGRQRKGLPVLVAEGDEGEFLGYASYAQFRPASGYRHTMEHSIYVNPHIHAKGVGSALLAALLERGRQAKNVKVLIGFIEATNEASLALHRKLGFEEAGRLNGVGYKFGKSLDVVLMQIDLTDEEELQPVSLTQRPL